MNNDKPFPLKDISEDDYRGHVSYFMFSLKDINEDDYRRHISYFMSKKFSHIEDKIKDGSLSEPVTWASTTADWEHTGEHQSAFSPSGLMEGIRVEIKEGKIAISLLFELVGFFVERAYQKDKEYRDAVERLKAVARSVFNNEIDKLRQSGVQVEVRGEQ